VQVNALQGALPDGIRVGTVDKFQGQEVPGCLISMTASSVDETLRGLDFLSWLNRINVAISRAKGFALVFGAPCLREAKCEISEQMRSVSMLCALSECGERVECGKASNRALKKTNVNKRRRCGVSPYFARSANARRDSRAGGCPFKALKWHGSICSQT